MKLWQKTLMFITSLAIVLTAVSYNKEEEQIPYTFEEIISICANDTNLDEIMTLDYSRYSASENELQNNAFIDSVKQLEEYLSVIKDLSEIEISTDQYDFDRKKDKQSQLSTDDVRLLIESYKNDELSPADKELVYKELTAIYNDYQSWINNDGLNVSEELLKRIIKGATCEVAGLEPEDYQRCKIYDLKPREGFNEPIANINIEGLYDARSLYTINLNSNSLKDVYETLCDIQSTEPKTLDKINECCEDSLYYSKIAITAGVELGGSKIIKAAEDNKTIIKTLQQTYEG